MKKYYLIILTLLLVIPFSVFAFDVKTLDVEPDGAKLNYNGTVDEGSNAVMCKLYNSNSEEIDMLSSAVDNNEFAGEFIVRESGNYTISCANYEGGNFKTKEFSTEITETYTVTFNTNEGSAVAEQHILDGSNAVKPEDPTKDGFVFLGWYEDKTLSVKFDFTKQITNDVTLYAKWEEVEAPQTNTYTVEFNTNGGGEFDPAIINPGDLVPLPPVSRDEYVFVGWYVDDTFAVEFFPDTIIESDLTLYAKWDKLITYANANITVPYDGENPDFNLVSSDSEAYDVEVTSWYLYESPYNTYLDPSSHFEVGKDYAVRVNFILKPGYQFAEDVVFKINDQNTACYGATNDREYIFYNIEGPVKYTVSFNTNSDYEIEDFMVEEGEFLELPEDPEKEGYRFAGWYNEELTEEFDPDTPITEDLTLYAKWVEIVKDTEYTISDEIGNSLKFIEEKDHTFELTIIDVVPLTDQELEEYVGIDREQYEFVKGLVEEQIEEYGDLVSFFIMGLADPVSEYEVHNGEFEIKIKITDAMKEYDTFIITGVQDDFTIEEPIELTVEGDYLVGTLPHLDAYVLVGDKNPVPDTYTVTFNTKGGSAIEAQQVTDGTNAVKPKDPTRYGYNFLGWYEDDTYSVEFSFTKPITEDITLYAKWEEIVEEKEYTATDEDGNSIQFTEEVGRTFKLTMIDVEPLNDTELEEYTDFDRDQYNSIKEIVEEEIKEYGDLVSFFDIVVEDTVSGEEIHTGSFEIKIKMTDEMKKYDIFKIAYVKDDFTIEEPIELIVEGDYLVGTLPHLSSYVLIGEKAASANTNTNPLTYDNIMMWVGMLFISIIGIAVVTIVALKRRVEVK